MDDKPKISPNSTYVLDEQDIEELDELSLTSIIRDASELTEQEKPEETPPELDDLEFGVLVPKD